MKAIELHFFFVNLFEAIKGLVKLVVSIAIILTIFLGPTILEGLMDKYL